MKRFTRHSKMFFKRNGSTILSIIGGVGVVATSIMAVKATPKALERLDQAKEEKGEDLTKLEVVKVAGAVYIPSIVMGVGTVACIFGANALNKREQASLMSAYALIDGAYKDYRNKVREIHGEEADKNIIDAIVVEKADDMYIRNGYMCGTCDLGKEESGEQRLFYDLHSGRYFTSTIEQVISAEYHLNRNYILRGYAYLNELYVFLGIEETDYGSVLGWAPNDDGMYWIEFDHDKTVTDDGLECYIITMPFEPTYDFWDY